MKVRTPLDIGLVIRERRRELNLSQADLARKTGVARQWIVAIEKGKPRAELGLVLRALSVLDVPLTINNDNPVPRSERDVAPVDIDEIVRAATEARK